MSTIMYARVSTSGGDGHDQLEACRRYLARHGHDNPARRQELVHNTPKGAKEDLLDALHGGQVRLVVSDLSRLSRSLPKLVKMLDELADHGVVLDIAGGS